MTAREKCQKCVRENDFAPVKKVAKSAQNGFHAHFWFSRGKKNTVSVSLWGPAIALRKSTKG